MELICKNCNSKEIETSSHLYFDKGIYAHRCKKCKTTWKGEKYEHDKYPEVNLKVAVGIKCSFCKQTVNAYISEHCHWPGDDILGYRCQECGGFWN